MTRMTEGVPPELRYNQLVQTDAVTVSVLENPPANETPLQLTPYVIAMHAAMDPANEVADWTLRGLNRNSQQNRYVPMNTSGKATLHGLGFIGTGNLNGCTAIGAAYRSGLDGIETFLSHYDTENVRQTDVNGKLKVSNLLAGFAGEQAVKVAVAYSRKNNPPHPEGTEYDPEDFPLDAIVDECLRLPVGSEVLLIPYGTSPVDDPSCHAFYIGRYADKIHFGWNGHKVEVGEDEPFDEKRRAVTVGYLALQDETMAGFAADGDPDAWLYE